MATLREVENAVLSVRVPAAPSEDELHSIIMNAFSSHNLPAQHEVSLGRGRRIDFLVGGVGVEIKKGKPNARALYAQLSRYAESPMVTELLCLVEKSVFLPTQCGGKTLKTISLNRLWGVSLP
ncbi:MAG: hypothetical protein PHU22_10450 [Eubacteriales bacterium]|nr:hypothetical protein [Eubacteriales bacterium]